MHTSAKQWLLPIILLLLWTAACYTVRYQLMENSRWVDVCYATPTAALCALRSNLGLVIHFGVLPIVALVFALPGLCVERPARAATGLGGVGIRGAGAGALHRNRGGVRVAAGTAQAGARTAPQRQHQQRSDAHRPTPCLSIAQTFLYQVRKELSTAISCAVSTVFSARNTAQRRMRQRTTQVAE